MCIVDEASEIQELETLKAIAFGGNTLVLMGDQNKQPLIDVSAVSLKIKVFFTVLHVKF